jgi:hypothetical protein
MYSQRAFVPFCIFWKGSSFIAITEVFYRTNEVGNIGELLRKYQHTEQSEVYNQENEKRQKLMQRR